MFTSKVQNDSWLLFMRITVPLLSALIMLALYKDWALYFSFDGLVQPDIMQAEIAHQKSWSIYALQEYLKNTHHYTVEYFILSKMVLGTYFLFLLFLACGFLTRLSAIVSAGLHLVILNSIHHFLYGADYFNTMLLFYCALFPLGKYYSIDNLLRKGQPGLINGYLESLFSTTAMLRLMQIHLGIAYFFSGFEKMLGFNWRNGESIWRAVHNYEGIIDFTALDSLVNTPLFLFLAWATMLLEMLYPIMANIRYTRAIWVTGIIGMHCSIVLILGLFHFSAIMIAFNLIAYVVPYSKSFNLSFSPTSILNPNTAS
ncbi:MAG: hypothetical protein IPL65_02020 [Lewinellaceae bacterium]|nr:hypothetical protein [Lewinellaceae bacterium]